MNLSIAFELEFDEISFEEGVFSKFFLKTDKLLINKILLREEFGSWSV